MKTEPQLLVRLLDVPGIESDAPGVEKFPVKAFQLLAVVLLAPSQRVTRRAVATLLWDKAPEVQAFNSLRALLMRARRAWPFEDPLFEVTSTMIGAGSGGRCCDLAEFLSITQATDPTDAMSRLQLFRGELLAGIGDADGHFLDWLELERSRLKQRFYGHVATALNELTSYGRAKPSVLRLIEEQLLGVEPYREESYTSLIHAYGRNGMDKDVRRVYGNLRTMLNQEFGSTPSPESEALVRRAFASTPQVQLSPAQAANNRSVPRIAFAPPEVGSEREGLIRALIGEVARELSRFRTFLVVAPYSSFRAMSAREVKADYIVTTAMSLTGGMLSCSLLAADTGVILWACELPGDREELTLTYRLLCNQTAAAMALAIEHDRLTNDLTYDGRAFALYLEAQQVLRSANLPRLRRARAVFRESSLADTSFAASRARLAQTYQLEWLMLGGHDPTLLLKAQGEALAAVNIDPNACDGYLMSGVVALYQRDFSRSADMFAQAEGLNPNSPDLLVQHADALAHLGDPDRAWTRFERAIDLNPTPPDHYWWAGASIAFQQHRFQDALEICGRVENEESVLRLLAASHGVLGNRAEAQRYGERVRELYPNLTADDIVRLAPNRLKADSDLFVKGLRAAGVN